MNIAVMKTKVEQFLAAELDAKLGALPGSEAGRSAAMDRFQRAGLPHRQIEAWKYSDLRNVLKDAGPLATPSDSAEISRDGVDRALGSFATVEAQRVVFVDGRLMPEVSNLSGPFSVAGIDKVLESDGEIATVLPTDESIVDLNRALVSDGVLVSVEKGGKPSKPLMIVNLVTGRVGIFVTLRHRLSFAAGVAASVIEFHGSVGNETTGQQNIVTEISVGDGAVVEHLQVGLEGAQRLSLVSTSCVLGREAIYRGFQFSARTAFARRQSFIRFVGEGAKLDLSGLMLGRGMEHCDTTLVIDHAVPGCESREHFKAVLNNSARAIFQAKVIVRQDAQKTDGKQMANALMLSPSAEFDSKPELEIYADDVVCGHGATVAEIDEDLMFYLRSRGIPEADARTLLVESFATEVLEKIASEELRSAVREAASDWLASNEVGGST